MNAEKFEPPTYFRDIAIEELEHVARLRKLQSRHQMALAGIYPRDSDSYKHRLEIVKNTEFTILAIETAIQKLRELNF